MPYGFAVLQARFSISFFRAVAGLAALGAAALAAVTIFPGAALAATPAVPAGFTIEPLASAPAGASKCDDIARLDAHLFVGCQNATQSTGGGGNSTLVEYSADGAIVNSWSLPDKIDGLGADPNNHRLIVTFNEDGNSHLATISPFAPPSQQVANYNYAPAPDSTGSGPLHTGGGTDSVLVDDAGNIYIVASAPSNPAGTAVFRVVLSPGSPGTATLSPTFLDNATAGNGNGAGTVTLGLTDPDSSAIVPDESPLYGGDYVLTDQTSNQLVFSEDIYAGTGLTGLSTTENGTPTALDDIRWSTADRGTLFVVNTGTNTIYKISGPFEAGTAFASNATNASEIDTVNLATGALTPFATGLSTPKGLYFVAGGHHRHRGEGEHNGSTDEGEDNGS